MEVEQVLTSYFIASTALPSSPLPTLSCAPPLLLFPLWGFDRTHRSFHSVFSCSCAAVEHWDAFGRGGSHCISWYQIQLILTPLNPPPPASFRGGHLVNPKILLRVTVMS